MASIDDVVKDFARVSERVLRDVHRDSRKGWKNPNPGKPFSWDGFMRPYLVYEEQKLAWWGGGEGAERAPIGKPDDYILIRDSPEQLRAFLHSLLGRGALYYGTSYWNMDGEDDTSDYAIWLHRNSQNRGFRRMFERTVIDLVVEELSPSSVPTKKRARSAVIARINSSHGSYEKFAADTFNETDAFHGVWWSGILYYASKSKKGEAFRESMERKLKRTYESGKVQFSRLSAEDQKAFRRQHMRFMTRHEFEEQTKQHSNRFLGLLEIAAYGAQAGKQFGKLYPVLRDAAESGSLMNLPEIQTRAGHKKDIDEAALTALKLLQNGAELGKFWLGRITSDPRIGRLNAAVLGYLSMYKSMEERQQHMPEILTSVAARGVSFGQIAEEFDHNSMKSGYPYVSVALEQAIFFSMRKSSRPFSHLLYTPLPPT